MFPPSLKKCWNTFSQWWSQSTQSSSTRPVGREQVSGLPLPWAQNLLSELNLILKSPPLQEQSFLFSSQTEVPPLSLNLENALKELVDEIERNSRDPEERAKVAERLMLASMTVMLALNKAGAINGFRSAAFIYTVDRLIGEFKLHVKSN